MKPAELFSPPVIVAAGFVLLLGLMLGLYALLTHTQRHTTREIRRAAGERGWRYRVRRWQGNPTAFRIDGQTRSGMPWILTSGNRAYDGPGWSVELVLRFPLLGGETDLSVLPRTDERHGAQLPASPLPPAAQSRVAAFSHTLANAVEFLQGAQELPSGFSAFDAVYQVLALPRQINTLPVDPALAGRILQWPAGAITPHSVLAWRDPYAFDFEARLPAPPNWETVSHFLNIAEDLVTRIPPPITSSTPQTLADRLLGGLMRLR